MTSRTVATRDVGGPEQRGLTTTTTLGEPVVLS